MHSFIFFERVNFSLCPCTLIYFTLISPSNNFSSGLPHLAKVLSFWPLLKYFRLLIALLVVLLLDKAPMEPCLVQPGTTEQMWWRKLVVEAINKELCDVKKKPVKVKESVCSHDDREKKWCPTKPSNQLGYEEKTQGENLGWIKLHTIDD